MPPTLVHVANLWTLMGHPDRNAEWSLDTKLKAIAEAGFQAVCWAPGSKLWAGAQLHGLGFVGGMASGDKLAFSSLLNDLRAFGATHVNVQLAAHDTPASEALDLTLTLLRQAATYGLKPAIESHRGTCTETPEKTYALAADYHRATGELLPVSWDFSHFAVLKHLEAASFTSRLLTHPELIQNAQQFHFRPFNGHHAQVPITHADGNLTTEVLDWIPFAKDILRVWLNGNRHTDREIFICPELGPVEGGYALSTFPNSWEDAKVLRKLIDKIWNEVLAE
jgi:hypothetical protein